MITYQDFERATDKLQFIATAISEHMRSEAYKTAEDARLYDMRRNTTINNVTRQIYTAAGIPIEDPVSSNNKIASNFFHRLNTQRVSYLLGNGVNFTDHLEKVENPDGTIKTVDTTKEAFDDDFDTTLYSIAYSGEIMGSSYAYVTQTTDKKYRLTLYSLLEFVPLLDETNGALRAGIRFWSLDWGKKPVTAVLYEADGITEYRTKEGRNGLDLEESLPKRKYSRITVTTQAGGEEESTGVNPFNALPIIPYYAENRQSTLVGMKAGIDSYDLIQSGFANDIQDCAQIYWLIGGALGTTEDAAKKFREKLLFQHIGVVDSDNSSVTPYTQEVPYESRSEYLKHMRSTLYEDFGGFDISKVTGGARTATEIEASYSPMDEEADAFETRVTRLIRAILALVGISDVPTYKRNRIANQLEQTQMVIMAGEYLSQRTVLEKLPWITVDEVDTIMAEKSGELDEQSENPKQTGLENGDDNLGDIGL